MEAGKLNRRLSLLAPYASENSIGEPTITWTQSASLWGSLLTLNMKDVQRQLGTANDAEIKFLVRFRTDVTNKMRLRYRGNDYDITYTEETQDRNGLFIYARRAA